MTDHITLPRSVVERSAEAIDALVLLIRSNAPHLSGKAMGFAEDRSAALRAALAGAEPQAKALTDDAIKAIVREASKGALTRRDGTTSERIVRAAINEFCKLNGITPPAEGGV